MFALRLAGNLWFSLAKTSSLYVPIPSQQMFLMFVGLFSWKREGRLSFYVFMPLHSTYPSTCLLSRNLNARGAFSHGFKIKRHLHACKCHFQLFLLFSNLLWLFSWNNTTGLRLSKFEIEGMKFNNVAVELTSDRLAIQSWKAMLLKVNFKG